jgi:hypothetical protein
LTFEKSFFEFAKNYLVFAPPIPTAASMLRADESPDFQTLQTFPIPKNQLPKSRKKEADFPWILARPWGSR